VGKIVVIDSREEVLDSRTEMARVELVMTKRVQWLIPAGLIMM
jgi:hypothetical protein